MAEDNNLIIADTNGRKGDQVKLQIVPTQPKPTLSHLPNRPAVDLAFHNLTYRVKEGRKSSEYPTVNYLLTFMCWSHRTFWSEDQWFSKAHEYIF